MDINGLLNKLTREAGISGFETDFSKSLRAMLSEYCGEVYADRSGSVFGLKRSSSPNAKTVMLDAHLDRIGLMVKEVDENGFVSFTALGGVDERILPASEVYILGKSRVYGVIGAKPPHLIKKTDKSETEGLHIRDLLIDTGLDSSAARELIGVGDPILLRSEYTPLLGSRACSAALDNRAGIAAVLTLLEKVSDAELPYNLLISFTSGEELGLHGAYSANFDTVPDLAVVIDVTHGTTHDSPKNFTSFPLGCGAVICRGPNLRGDITDRIIDLAKESEIPYAIEVAAGCSGTNAWAFQISRGGIPCALISIPLRYMHTTVEVIDTNDIAAVGLLLEKIVTGGVDLA